MSPVGLDSMTEKKKIRSMRYSLEDIIECIHKVQNYSSRGRDSFFVDEILQDAIIRRLEIIGEASNRLPKEMLEQYPEFRGGKLSDSEILPYTSILESIST